VYFFLFSCVVLGLAVYVLLHGDMANAAMVLLLALVFMGHGKKRCFILDKDKRNFVFEERNALGASSIQGSLDDIASIEIHYGRGRTTIPSGFIVINMKDGRKMKLNEYGRCLLGENKNALMVGKLRRLLHEKHP
jgi:hypothetical protein